MGKFKILLIALTFSWIAGNAQSDTTEIKVQEIQMNLNKYYQQTRTGTGIFAFGTILGTATLLGVSHRPEDRDMRNALIGVSAGSMIVGLLINMEAIKFIGEASEIRISPTHLSIKF